MWLWTWLEGQAPVPFVWAAGCGVSGRTKPLLSIKLQRERKWMIHSNCESGNVGEGGGQKRIRVCVCVCAWSPPPTQHAHTQSRWQPVMLCPLLLCVPGSMRNSLMACGTLVWVYVQVLTSASLLTHHLKRFRNIPQLSQIFALPGVKMLIGFLSLIFKWMSEKPAEVTNLLTRSAWIPWLILCLGNDFLRKLMNILFEMNFFLSTGN